MLKFQYLVKSGENEILRGVMIAESLKGAQSSVLRHISGRRIENLTIEIDAEVTMSKVFFGELFKTPYSYKLASQPRRPW
jgi:hypothetical protein